MDKVRKQIAINFLLVVVSVLVIILAKSFTANAWLGLKDWLGADIVFVMITSLVTMLGWRYVEKIEGFQIYNIVMAIVLFFYIFEYGYAIADCNEIVQQFIFISLILFILLYAIEIILVIRYFQSQIRDSYNDHVGY